MFGPGGVVGARRTARPPAAPLATSGSIAPTAGDTVSKVGRSSHRLNHPVLQPMSMRSRRSAHRECLQDRFALSHDAQRPNFTRSCFLWKTTALFILRKVGSMNPKPKAPSSTLMSSVGHAHPPART